MNAFQLVFFCSRRDSSFEIRRHVTLEEAVGEYWARSSFYLYYRDHPEKPGPIEDYTEK